MTEETNKNETKIHTSLIIYALVAIFCYYIGSFLIVFLRNDLNGTIVSAVPYYEVSWKLAFENFPQLLKNLYDSFFGYFTAYGQLYNRSTAFLIPVDIGVKLVAVFYFLLYWIPWDTKRAYKLGYFSTEYPYVSDEFKEELAENKPKQTPEVSGKSEQNAMQLVHDYSDQEFNNTEDQKSVALYPQYNLDPYLKENPYVRAQLLKSQKPSYSSTASLPQLTTNISDDDEDDDDDDDVDPGILPFSGVHKPLEEIYQKYEKSIYDLIRKRVLPGSNILLVGYFSTLFIIDLANPITIVLYILGIMSMFWCMQSFLLVIDYFQFPPE